VKANSMLPPARSRIASPPPSTKTGEAGTNNLAGKSESQNSYRGRRPTSDNPKQHKSRNFKKKPSGHRRFEFFPAFGFSICFAIRDSDFGFR
jgi:hypothetical protein